MPPFLIKVTLLICILFQIDKISAQSFIRSELPTALTTPWEITYGPDNYLWLTESGGKVVRVSPVTGAKTIVFTAPDYFGGSLSEQLNTCAQVNIGAGTLGLTLHPDFTSPGSSYIYYVYSYNSGTTQTPATKFKILRLTWDANTATVTGSLNLVTDLPTAYDHLGGRLLAVKQNGISYLYFSIGDNGISEDNYPNCYSPASSNPNNFTMDVNYKNGKIHRFNMDGTIPNDNPVAGNSMYTRGHRNPQGLAYNPVQGVLYDIEHGDRTDDEINVLEKGKNYGWKKVRGYHADNNYPGEATFVAGYTINPAISGDGLKEAMFAWCATPQPTTGAFLDWCTVAPSDGIYYNANGTGIPGWNNSLLVVTLKNGSITDNQVFKIQLNTAGIGIAPSTTLTPNPQSFFAADQALNGRLRDITVSPDGKTIYLINNGGAATDKITVYTLDPVSGIAEQDVLHDLQVYPNPAAGTLTIRTASTLERVSLQDALGRTVYNTAGNPGTIDLSPLSQGLYVLRLYTAENRYVTKKIIKN